MTDKDFFDSIENAFRDVDYVDHLPVNGNVLYNNTFTCFVVLGITVATDL